MIPVKSQTPAFQIICHHPGRGGSIVVMSVIRKNKVMLHRHRVNRWHKRSYENS